MRAYRALTHALVLLLALGIAGYSSIGKRPLATVRLGTSNADALVIGQGGAVGQLALGRQGTIVKPVSVPTSTPASHTPIEYVIAQNDDLQAVATRFKLASEDICGSNMQLVSDPRLKPGDKLVLPPLPGIVITVRRGESAEKISQTYQVGVDGLLDYNYLRQPTDVKEGMRLVLPGGKGLQCPAVGGVPEGTPAGRPGLTGAPGCPMHGYVLTQPFGPSRFEGFHAGIDLAAAEGSPIYAAADGVATTNQGGYGYGNNVTVKVSSERTDLYAHLSKILVSPGQSVEAGQVIGREGSTGFSTGPHLHYEVRINGVATDPAPLIRC